MRTHGLDGGSDNACMVMSGHNVMRIASRAHVIVLAILAACGGSGQAGSDPGTDTTGAPASTSSAETSSEGNTSAESTTSGESTTSTSGDVEPGCEEMALVPAGPFWMGCNEAVDLKCEADERPYHEVTLDAFEIDRCEVDTASYGACVEAGVCPNNELDEPAECYQPAAGEGDLAVNCITWAGADAYCAWVGKQLPTEAQWEKAARGTDGRVFPWGNDDPDCELAVMHDVVGEPGCDEGHAAPPGSRPAGASPYGLFDMAGNMNEWVADDYDENYYADSPAQNPTGPEPTEGAQKLIRGGSYTSDEALGGLRASTRVPVPIDGTGITLGFRCVAE